MKAGIFASSSAVLAALLGSALLRAAGISPHLRDMLLALGAALIACMFAALPLVAARRGSTIPVTQAGLIATLLHMMVLVVCGGVVLFAHLSSGWPFVLWLYGMYFVTLIGLVMGISRAIHAAPHVDPAPQVEKRGEPK